MKTYFNNICCKIGAMVQAPSKKQAQAMLFSLGLCLLVVGLMSTASAVTGFDGTRAFADYNDSRITQSVNFILTYIEGSFGALVMVSAGIGAILSAAFGAYNAALGLLVVAVGSFILRSLVSTFFNDSNIQA